MTMAPEWKMSGGNTSTTSSQDSLITDSSKFKEKTYSIRSSSQPTSAIVSGFSPNNSTNTYNSNFNHVNSTNNLATRCCFHMLNCVQRNIRRCVTALVIISLFSIIFFTQYMDNSTIARYVYYFEYLLTNT